MILISLIVTYIIRHYIFTLIVLYHNNEPILSCSNKTEFEPMDTILIPVHNEEYVIDRILQRMVELIYPKLKLEVIVIDDASIDNTFEKAKWFAEKYDFIKIIQRNQIEGGRGKPEALNFALRHVSGDIIYCFDTDYCPQRNIIEKLNINFIDPKMGAVQGKSNRPK